MITAERIDERAFAEIKRLCHMGLGTEALAPRLTERLKETVPFDGHALVTIDPLSGMATDFSFSEEMGTEEDARFFVENIYFEDDVLDYGWMASNRVAAMTLSEATGGRPERALRYREYNQPKGFGPGMRAAATANEKLWGGLCLVRGSDAEDFSEREVALLRRVSPHLGVGMRAAALSSRSRLEPADGDAAGVVVFDHKGRVAHYTQVAHALLRELGASETGRLNESGLPIAVWAVVGALRRTLGPGGWHPSAVPCLHARGRSGRWLTLQASLTEADGAKPAETVVVVAPASPGQVARLNKTAYGFSAREKEVIDLVLRGCSTREICRTLYISESTVQGHLSHVFEKVGVKSRRELIKRLFLDDLATL